VNKENKHVVAMKIQTGNQWLELLLNRASLADRGIHELEEIRLRITGIEVGSWGIKGHIK